jgi:hypothetical protein
MKENTYKDVYFYKSFTVIKTCSYCEHVMILYIFILINIIKDCFAPQVGGAKKSNNKTLLRPSSYFKLTIAIF